MISVLSLVAVFASAQYGTEREQQDVYGGNVSAPTTVTESSIMRVPGNAGAGTGGTGGTTTVIVDPGTNPDPGSKIPVGSGIMALVVMAGAYIGFSGKKNKRA